MDIFITQFHQHKMKKLIIISTFVFLFDLISKIVVSNVLSLNKSVCIIKNFFYLTYSKNYGAAFSIMQNSRFLLITISVIVLFIIVYYINKNNKNNKIEIVGYSIIIGGLIGNLFDRIVYGYVIDFFDFYIFDYDYAIFNIADCAIIIGIFILIIDNIRRIKKDENNSR